MATSLHAASGRYSAGAVCAAVCVQRRRTVAKAHTGHRNRTGFVVAKDLRTLDTA
jgi:hypothetical protein